MNKLKRFLSIGQTALKSSWIDKKVVVFESDDWGSIRTPKGDLSKHFAPFNLDLLKNPYHRYDVLESPSDVSGLLTSCEEIEKLIGKKPKLTLNFVMANPDFNRIKADAFSSYYYEDFRETYKRYYSGVKGLNLVSEGQRLSYFLPQFHGREHIQVPFWLEMLRNRDLVFTKAFELGFWGIGTEEYAHSERHIQASFDIRDKEEQAFTGTSIIEGLELFANIFGFESESFIPNNYIWPSSLNQLLVEKSVKFLQGMKKELHPRPVGQNNRNSNSRYAGKKTPEGLIQLVRNTTFEPSFYKNRENELQKCLREIKTAFLFKQPAVISTHRINFVGGLDENNRTENLALFKRLILEINRNWPEVEFWNSVELGEYYSSLDRESSGN